MVGCHLKTGFVQYRSLLLLHAEALNTIDAALECHLVCEQLDMSVVNLNAVLPDGELDLLNDAAACCLNAQHLLRLHNMIGRGGSEVNTRCAHDLS